MGARLVGQSRPNLCHSQPPAEVMGSLGFSTLKQGWQPVTFLVGAASTYE